MLQLHLNDQQFDCLLKCALYQRLDGIRRYWCIGIRCFFSLLLWWRDIPTDLYDTIAACVLAPEVTRALAGMIFTALDRQYVSLLHCEFILLLYNKTHDQIQNMNTYLMMCKTIQRVKNKEFPNANVSNPESYDKVMINPQERQQHAEQCSSVSRDVFLCLPLIQ